MRYVKSPSETSLELRARLEQVVHDESQALNKHVAEIGSLLDDLQYHGERLRPIWSNDFWQSLDERLDPAHRLITPIGVPAWFKGDAPALIELFDSLVDHLRCHLPSSGFEGEITLNPKRAYVDLIWQGSPVPEGELTIWREHPLTTLPLSPSVADILRQHATDIWSVADADKRHARLRLPLPTIAQTQAPVSLHLRGRNSMTLASHSCLRLTRLWLAELYAAWISWRLIRRLLALSCAEETR